MAGACIQGDTSYHKDMKKLVLVHAGARGYRILPVHEVVNKAMFINGNDNGHRSPILTAIDQIGPTEQLLFPFMNFTCSGGLTRLMFVANRHRESNQNLVTSWPMFSLWQTDEYYGNLQRSVGPVHPNQITSL